MVREGKKSETGKGPIYSKMLETLKTAVQRQTTGKTAVDRKEEDKWKTQEEG